MQIQIGTQQKHDAFMFQNLLRDILFYYHPNQEMVQLGDTKLSLLKEYIWIFINK